VPTILGYNSGDANLATATNYDQRSMNTVKSVSALVKEAVNNVMEVPYSSFYEPETKENLHLLLTVVAELGSLLCKLIDLRVLLKQ